jgi:hypothetical protein
VVEERCLVRCLLCLPRIITLPSRAERSDHKPDTSGFDLISDPATSPVTESLVSRRDQNLAHCVGGYGGF